MKADEEFGPVLDSVRLEAIQKLARGAFDTKDDALMSKLVGDFAALTGPERVHAWSFLTSGGLDDLDFIKEMHRNLGALILEVFKK
jgi:hypothetical protein